MANKPRIIFMGTPAFAVASLEAILKEDMEVAAVVTAPDKPSGRGLKLSSSEVKDCAVKHGLQLLQPERLRSPEFIDAIKELKPDIMVVVAFRMLPREVWSIARMGTFNLHASLLPQYRGAAPINHAIINGETISGCTTFLIDDQIDTGQILRQQSCPVLPEDTAGMLHDRLMHLGKTMVTQTIWGLFNGSIAPMPQSHTGELKTAPKLSKSDCLIDWNRSGEEIINRIRGLSPYPAAYTHIKLKDCEQPMILKIYNATFEASEPENPGSIYCNMKNSLEIMCKDGKIRLSDIQLQGKKRMDVNAFLCGNLPERVFSELK